MPYIVHRDELSSKRIQGSGGERIDLLGEEVSKLVGADFELLVLEAGEATPMHRHDQCEHYLFILQGEGFLVLEDGEHPIGPNFMVSIDPGELHALRNSNQNKLEILAFLIPSTGEPSIVGGDE
jgi:mannose-6-phosphate isomerase-like protein (cupin superfamily)